MAIIKDVFQTEIIREKLIKWIIIEKCSTGLGIL